VFLVGPGEWLIKVVAKPRPKKKPKPLPSPHIGQVAKDGDFAFTVTA
jgi:hypothetical protein